MLLCSLLSITVITRLAYGQVGDSLPPFFNHFLILMHKHKLRCVPNTLDASRHRVISNPTGSQPAQIVKMVRLAVAIVANRHIAIAIVVLVVALHEVHDRLHRCVVIRPQSHRNQVDVPTLIVEKLSAARFENAIFFDPTADNATYFGEWNDYGGLAWIALELIKATIAEDAVSVENEQIFDQFVAIRLVKVHEFLHDLPVHFGS